MRDETGHDNPGPVEKPEDKDLQDHRFGLEAERRKEAAELARDEEERPAEPHAGGRA